MGKKKAPKKISKKPKIIKISPEEQVALAQALKESNLDESIADMFIDLMGGSRWLLDGLEKGRLSIAKLRKLFGVTLTERSKNRKSTRDMNSPNDTDNKDSGENDKNHANAENNSESKAQDKSEKPKRKGHGRIAADAYSGAHIVDLDLPNLKPGDICPEDFCDGKLYEMSDPGVMIKITGSPIASATRYNLQKLRCLICDTIFTAPLPKNVSQQKYDDTFVAMLMINKYFMSMPLYRQEKLQNYLGVPLPAGTQWDLMKNHADVLEKLYVAFCYDAAQGKGLSFDDTRAKILEQIALSKSASADEKVKKTCFTTGVVSAHNDHMVYVFVTNNEIAGKSIAPFLSLREDNLPEPYLMCDALSANIPEGISRDLYILCFCLVHARRQFYELPDGYDDLADTVINLIGKIYDQERQTKELNAAERLAHHKIHSQSLMDELKEYLEDQQSQHEPNGVAGNAIKYMLKRWTSLTQFLRHADIPLDNNLTERALKLIIQVRKSAMFYKTLNSALIASHIQTALYSAAQNEINPYEYMLAVLRNKEKVMAAPEKWLPWKYQTELKLLEDGKALQAEESSGGTP